MACKFTLFGLQPGTHSKRKFITATKRLSSIINGLLSLFNPEFNPCWISAGCPRNSATTPTSTQRHGALRPFDIHPIICFLCWKTNFLKQRDPLVCSASFCLFRCNGNMYSKSLFCTRQKIYPCDTAFYFSPYRWQTLKVHWWYLSRGNPNQSEFLNKYNQEGIFQTGNTDSFFRAYFMNSKHVKTTDIILVYNPLITAFVVDYLRQKSKKTQENCV